MESPPTPSIRTTFQSLPRDVHGEIASRLGWKELGRLQSASKRLGTLSKRQMEELCKSLPTEEEIALYIKEIIETERFSTIVFYDVNQRAFTSLSIDASHLSLPIGNMRTILDSVDEQQGAVTLSNNSMLSSLAESKLPTGIQGIPNPFIVLAILRRRQSCVSSDKDYGLQMTRDYAWNVLKPHLASILGEEIDIDNLPIPQTIQDIDEYKHKLSHLRLLASMWIHGQSMPVANTLEPQNIMQMEEAALLRFTRFYVDDIVEGFRLLNTTLVGLQIQEAIRRHIPTTKEIVDYIEQRLQSNELFQLRFLNGDNVIILNIHHRQRVEYFSYTVQDREIGLPRVVGLAIITGVKSRQIGLRVLEEILTEKKLPGKLAPQIILDILRTRRETAQNNRYGIDIARQYFERHTRELVQEFSSYDIGQAVFVEEIGEDMLNLLDPNLNENEEEEQEEEQEEEREEEQENIEEEGPLESHIFNIQKLLLVIYFWLERGSPAARTRLLGPKAAKKNWKDESIKIVLNALHELRHAYVELADVVGGEEAEESSSEDD